MSGNQAGVPLVAFQGSRMQVLQAPSRASAGLALKGRQPTMFQEVCANYCVCMTAPFLPLLCCRGGRHALRDAPAVAVLPTQQVSTPGATPMSILHVHCCSRA